MDKLTTLKCEGDREIKRETVMAGKVQTFLHIKLLLHMQHVQTQHTQYREIRT